MKNKSYELLEHTADIGIRVKGKTLKELFANAAKALFEIIAEEKPSAKKIPKEFRITQRAESAEGLFINWLNELLSLSAAKGVIFSKFQIRRLDSCCLQALAIGNDIRHYRINSEVKAATYHCLKIEEIKGGWQVEVIFDV